MSQLQWSPTLELGMPQMDAVHQEFVDALALVDSASDENLLTRWEELIHHTDGHFGQEDAWMLASGFAADNCHSSQHDIILQVMREGLRRGQAGDLALVRQMASELAIWFPQHAQSMDAGLAAHLQHIGFDPQSGRAQQTVAADSIHGCSGSCGDATLHEASATVTA